MAKGLYGHLEMHHTIVRREIGFLGVILFGYWVDGGSGGLEESGGGGSEREVDGHASVTEQEWEEMMNEKRGMNEKGAEKCRLEGDADHYIGDLLPEDTLFRFRFGLPNSSLDLVMG